MEPIVIATADHAINGRLFRPARVDPPAGGLLFIHGLHSDQTGYAVRAETATDALGVVCLTFDLSGHGTSPGVLDEITPNDHLRAVTAAYDRLRHELAADRPIGVCGASYGAYMATLLLGSRSVARLLLRAPALVRDDDLARPLGSRRRAEPDSARAGLDNLHKFAGQVMILESGDDEVIPHEFVQAYLDACCGHAAYEVIPEARHALTEERWQRQFVEAIVRWFAPMVSAAAARGSSSGGAGLER